METSAKDLDCVSPHRATTNLCFAIPSRIGAVISTVNTIRSIMEWMAVKRDWVFRAELSLHEALLNAHLHGNRANPQREIRVDCALSSSKVEIDVEDDGAGHNVLPNGKVPDYRPQGRGLFLIRQLMDSVALQRNGTRIVMSLNKE